MRPALLLAVLSLSGCTQFPELDARARTDMQAVPWPALVPLDGAVAEAGNTTAAEAARATLEARAAALRARAAGLTRPVMPAHERAPLAAAGG